MAGHAVFPLVIASEAKQSSPAIEPDRFVAALLAMTI
jgi:hypothetical protein